MKRDKGGVGPAKKNGTVTCQWKGPESLTGRGTKNSAGNPAEDVSLRQPGLEKNSVPPRSGGREQTFRISLLVFSGLKDGGRGKVRRIQERKGGPDSRWKKKKPSRRRRSSDHDSRKRLTSCSKGKSKRER